MEDHVIMEYVTPQKIKLGGDTTTKADTIFRTENEENEIQKGNLNNDNDEGTPPNLHRSHNKHMMGKTKITHPRTPTQAREQQPQKWCNTLAPTSELEGTTTTAALLSRHNACSITTTAASVTTTICVTSSSYSTNYSTTVVITPPPKRVQRVRNPFEAALAERLHLPIIGSPSLFHRPSPSTQMSSTQFEWTIDEVSSIKPAHVEPHETQFQDSPDPEYEAKAQMAISSFFKENQIVPSPVDCPLRSQRIRLSEINSHTPIVKPGRRIRDVEVQTELSLPMNLPPELEEALKAFIQPQPSHMLSCYDAEESARDTSSMRRKLFDIHNIVLWENEGPSTAVIAPRTAPVSDSPHSSPLSNSLASQQQQQQYTAIVGILSDSSDKSILGSLSPLSATEGMLKTPSSTQSIKSNSKFEGFPGDLGDLSPIEGPNVTASRNRSSGLRSKRRGLQSMSALAYDDEEDGHDDSQQQLQQQRQQQSSPLSPSTCNEIGESGSETEKLENGGSASEMSINSKIRLLKVNNTTIQSVMSFDEGDGDEKAHDAENSNADSSGGSSSNDNNDTTSIMNISATPSHKRRNAAASVRKNLSRSFSVSASKEGSTSSLSSDSGPDSNHTTTEEDITMGDQSQPDLHQQYRADAVKGSPPKANRWPASSACSASTSASTSSTSCPHIYRTDSGFNEFTNSNMTSSSSALWVGMQQSYGNGKFHLNNEDVTPSPDDMICCSTPSKNPVE